MPLDIITDDTLHPFEHGFFTRQGGVSKGDYAGLNCGQGSADDEEFVSENRRRAAEHLGMEHEHLVSLYQTHSIDVLHITGPLNGSRPRADAMVSRTPGVGLGVLTADCQPVLFADPKAGVVGAAHAGWKGALDGILGATVDAMVAIGAKRGGIQAVIGPCIGQKSYEVGPEFREKFLRDDPENDLFFETGQPGKYQFDLPAFGLMRLSQAGIGTARWTGHCTYTDPERFFSYRRGQHAGASDYGRLLAAIRI